MDGLNLKELIDMVASDVDEPAKRLEKMFEWDHSRSHELAKWALGASIALSAAAVSPWFRGELKAAAWAPAMLIAISIFSAAIGLFLLYRMRNYHKNYVAALLLLSELNKISQFIKLYRNKK